MARLSIAPGAKQPNLTAQLRRMTKLPAKNRGDLSSAVISAGHYAKKTGRTMYVYIGNSYGHVVYRVSDKPGEYLNPINNTGEKLFSVTPDLVVSSHALTRTDLKEDVMAKKRTTRKANFDDQDAVLDEVAQALDIDPGELEIDEHELEGFGAGTVYKISFIGHGKISIGKEWGVVENNDQFEALALAVVKQDLEEDPSMFNREFIEQHINETRLRRDLEPDVQAYYEDYLREMSDREFWRTAKDYIDVPDEDDDGETPDPEDYVDDVAEKMTEEKLRDPIAYLEEIYDEREAVEKAIEIGGIDVNAAAEDAVNTDGAAHFLARYDGNYYETKSGFVYWRDN